METVQFSSRVQSHRIDKRGRLRLLELIKCSLYSDSRYSWRQTQCQVGHGVSIAHSKICSAGCYKAPGYEQQPRLAQKELSNKERVQTYEVMASPPERGFPRPFHDQLNRFPHPSHYFSLCRNSRSFLIKPLHNIDKLPMRAGVTLKNQQLEREPQNPQYI